MKKLTVLFAILLCGLVACEAQEKKRPMDNEAIQFAMSMGIGWNLGNQMDAKQLRRAADQKRKQMLAAAKDLNFDLAATLRDELLEMENRIQSLIG